MTYSATRTSTVRQGSSAFDPKKRVPQRGRILTGAKLMPKIRFDSTATPKRSTLREELIEVPIYYEGVTTEEAQACELVINNFMSLYGEGEYLSEKEVAWIEAINGAEDTERQLTVVASFAKDANRLDVQECAYRLISYIDDLENTPETYEEEVEVSSTEPLSYSEEPKLTHAPDASQKPTKWHQHWGVRLGIVAVFGVGGYYLYNRFYGKK